ncbi:hypothetical protein [Streptomyces fungicidicus]|uniref:hypothetical protein n=1 Tax=Streptomyces fungicidicus TaxID=68203 RepID=UPI00383027FE
MAAVRATGHDVVPGSWWVRASAALAASGTGGAAGFSPLLAADVALLGAGPDRRIPVRVAVVRAGPGPVPLLTGLTTEGDLLPLSVVRAGAPRPELRLTPGQIAALNRLARSLAARPALLRRALRTAPATAAWLGVRAHQDASGQVFFGPAHGGADEIARTWRRCQDLAATGRFAPDLDASAASLAACTAEIHTPYGASPLPWPAPDADGLRIEVVDLPVPSPDRSGPAAFRALRRRTLEQLNAAHLVLAAAPAAALSGDAHPSAAVRELGVLLERTRRLPDTRIALLATVSGLRGAQGMVDLGGWLRGPARRVLGPAAHELPLYAVALTEAERAGRLLRDAARRPRHAVLQAEADWAASGAAALADGVLRPLLDGARDLVPGLTARRLLATCRDIRVVCRGAGRRTGPWDELEAFATAGLARRIVRRLTAGEGR